MTVSGLRAAWGAAALAGFAAGLLALRAASARAPAFTATERETLPSLAVFS
jgi:ABC-type proline/glycine betaine transport system permease subunit